MLDVEDLAIGSAAADLGSVLASLVYLRRAERLSAPAVRELASTFLAGYSNVRRLPNRAALAWHSAAALFIERAVRAVTRIRPLGLQHLEALLTDVHTLSTGADDVCIGA